MTGTAKKKAEIFFHFIELLRHEQIDYAVLGDTRSYPDAIGSDADIVIPAAAFSACDELMARFCTQYGFLLCNCLQHEITAKYFVVAAMDHTINQVVFLAIDLCSDYNRDGRMILPAQQLLTGRRVHEVIEGAGQRSFLICRASSAFLYYLIKKAEKGSLSNVQFEYLKSLWAEDSLGIMDELRKIFSTGQVDALARAFDPGSDADEKSISLNDLNATLQNKYRVSLPDRIKESIRTIRRIVRPTGLVIGFLGCDGSGKSTLINAIENEWKHDEAFRRTSYFHLYPRKSENRGGKQVADPHLQQSRGVLASNAKIFYLFLKYLAGYWLYIYPRKIRSSLVIFDRYYHDLLVDHRRYRHGGGLGFARLVGKLIPKPDLLFIVDAPAETILARKQEVSPQEVMRQQKAYPELGRSMHGGRVIDNSSEISKAAFSTQQAIVSFLADRYRMRKRK